LLPKVLSRFISAELKYEGFDSAEPVALERLEVEVINCVFSIHLGTSHCAQRANPLVIQELHRKIHDYANLANRTAPLASDMYDICQESGLETEDLRLTSELSKLRRRGALK
jgi:transcription initiation factor TFIID subunit 8